MLSNEKIEDKQYTRPEITDHGDLTELTAGRTSGARADHLIKTNSIVTFVSGP